MIQYFRVPLVDHPHHNDFAVTMGYVYWQISTVRPSVDGWSCTNHTGT